MTVLTVAALAGGILLADHLKQGDATGSPTLGLGSTTPSSSSDNSSGGSSSSGSSSTASGGSYKDGTYTATSSYFVPHGQETIQVTLTVKNNTVTSAQIQNSESDPTSADFQQSFAAEYQSQVVGKPLADLQLDVVAGASDTTQGFNQAVSQIASLAKA